MAKSIASLASDKKAEETVILDMRKAANFCDYFVICTGTSDRHIHAIGQGIDEGLEQQGIPVRHKQGAKDGRWVLLDMGSVVTHIFDRESREFYGLEYLWQDAPKIKWEE